MLSLYQPEKYKVLTGEGTNTSLCTVWNEPEKIWKQSSVVRQQTAITGTLYSRQGVNVILRNLALNPEIRTLVLWGNGTLSNTPFGLAGKHLLTSLWANGVGDDHVIKGTQFTLEKEISLSAIEAIRNSVSMVDVSHVDLLELEQTIQASASQTTAPYREKESFPEPVSVPIEMFPSEEVGFIVHGTSVLDAWRRVVERIMRYGTIKGTQYGYQQRELIGVTWTINKEDPFEPDLSIAYDWPDDLRKTIGADKDALSQYHAVFLSPDLPPGIVYTYGNRLMRYPNGDQPIDQVKEIIIKCLKESPDSRRAVATTIVPSIDKDSKEPPCLTQVQCLQSRGRLHMLVTGRSHDIFKASVPNAFGLRTLQYEIAQELGFDVGTLQITSQSAHIYEQDWEDARKLARCAFWDREPSLTFDPATESDPRGLFIIRTKDNMIEAHFKSPEGADLLQITGTSAREVGKKIAQLELILRTDHMLDIAMELQKAETAISADIQYHQDKPLIV